MSAAKKKASSPLSGEVLPPKNVKHDSIRRGHDARTRVLAQGNKNHLRTELQQTLISVLNELDKETGKQKKYLLVDRLVTMAIGGTINIKGQRFVMEPNLQAMKEVMDRLVGKVAQQHKFGGGEGDEDGHVTLIFGTLPKGQEP